MATAQETTDIAVLTLRGKYANGQNAVLDAADYPIINNYTWYMNKNGYVVTTYFIKGSKAKYGKEKFVTVFLHKLIAELHGSKSELVDHKNHDKLNNRWSNLRPCTFSQNMFNKTMAKNNKSGFKGVCWNKWNKRWMAATSVDKKRYHLGYFKTAKEAAIAYDNFVKIHAGKFAFTNGEMR